MTRRCEHCGCDSYFSDEFPRVVRQAAEAEDAARRATAQLAMRDYEIERMRREQSVNRSWANTKVDRQRKRIIELEEHLRAVGRPPYAPSPVVDVPEGPASEKATKDPQQGEMK